MTIIFIVIGSFICGTLAGAYLTVKTFADRAVKSIEAQYPDVKPMKLIEDIFKK